jgi:hypothetical protein
MNESRRMGENIEKEKDGQKSCGQSCGQKSSLLYNNIRHSFSSCFLLDFEIEMDTVSGMAIRQPGPARRRGGGGPVPAPVLYPIPVVYRYEL